MNRSVEMSGVVMRKCLEPLDNIFNYHVVCVDLLERLTLIPRQNFDVYFSNHDIGLYSRFHVVPQERDYPFFF